MQRQELRGKAIQCRSLQYNPKENPLQYNSKECSGQAAARCTRSLTDALSWIFSCVNHLNFIGEGAHWGIVAEEIFGLVGPYRKTRLDCDLKGVFNYRNH